MRRESIAAVLAAQCLFAGGALAQLRVPPAMPIAAGSVVPGTGLVADGRELKVNPDAVRTYLKGSASLNFGTIAAMSATTLANGSHCQRREISVPGAVIGDRVVVGAPAELLTNSITLQGWAVIFSDTVSIRLCNYTSVSLTPPAWTWNVDVVKSF
jgi:hypothetical protein